MALERTLFERILKPEDPGTRLRRESTESRVDRATESILRHLRQVLNSYQGNCATALDYGMPSMETFSGSRNEFQFELEQALRSAIMKYEPRMRDVRVELLDGEETSLTPKFAVTGQLNPRPEGARKIYFTTVWKPTGMVELER